MKILVTGATGLIGQQLIRRLQKDGYYVKALVRPQREVSWIETVGVELCRGDIGDLVALKQAMQGCQQVFHLAAKVHGADVTRDSLWAVNVRGTDQVAQASLQTGVERLIYCSTVAIYGRTFSNRAITEDTLPRPDSPYGESKLRTEKILQTYAQRNGLPVVIVRPSTVFGPGASSWAGLFQAIANRQFRLMGSGQGHHHITDVTDMVEGLMQCSTIPAIEGRTYILAGPESISLAEFVTLIGKAVGVSDLPAALPEAPLQVYKQLNRLTYQLTGYLLPKADRIDLFLGDRSYNLSRARQELNYNPQISPEETIHRTADWFRHQGYLPLLG
ncbi:NAD-dependent epimerase/dehydratase family protein [Microcystis aeruginosa BLCCF158]|jgi:nucleoside-diphosphate-sugar epimerase|uniref:NAD-dependent epimerase/dehydratase family protein n=1 Tax=Microcystis aeruginosa BLCC-F158 TaxID=2755316 RepID=A0A841V8C1_MICAE|nr:NAD-dependent epimerase/dehydratase family protein [Microcystis aeruginosa]MBC1196446.1 NAD-dependent epimerase/dehydratase family protein [Microcystis aeruginosa BLCC-F158]